MGEKSSTSQSGGFFRRPHLNNTLSISSTNIGLTFLIMLLLLVFTGFDFNIFSLSKAFILYLFLLYFHSGKIHVLEKYSFVDETISVPCSTISLLAFSQSDFLRGLDVALLLTSLSLLGLALLSERNFQKNNFSFALIISASHSFYSLFIEIFRSPNFLSSINYIQIFLH